MARTTLIHQVLSDLTYTTVTNVDGAQTLGVSPRQPNALSFINPNNFPVDVTLPNRQGGTQASTLTLPANQGGGTSPLPPHVIGDDGYAHINVSATIQVGHLVP